MACTLSSDALFVCNLAADCGEMRCAGETDPGDADRFCDVVTLSGFDFCVKAILSIRC